MAAVAAILGAIVRTLVRDLRSLQAIQGNNFFWLVALILYGQASSGIFLVLVVGVLVILPFTAEPLRKIPPDRLALWPLTARQRFALRAASLVLSPVVLIAVVILIWTSSIGPAVLIVSASIIFQVLAAVVRRASAWAPRSNLLRWAPQFPGRIGQLYRKDLRQMFSTLDPYIALVLAASSCAYRFLATSPDAAAFPILSVMITVALSTYAQCVFGLDGDAGIMRYRLMPLRGWQIFLSKDLAFLSILLCLVAPLNPAAGMSAGLIALAVGRKHALEHPVPQSRWRLTSGALFPIGLIQIVSMVAVSSAVTGASGYWFLVAVVVYFGSLWWYGREWDLRR